MLLATYFTLFVWAGLAIALVAVSVYLLYRIRKIIS
jgi:hypothetical protein